MKKTLIGVGMLIAAFIVIFFALNSYRYNGKEPQGPAVVSHKDATYVIDGAPTRLLNGVSEVEGVFPDSASKIITQHFGNEVRLDADGDGREDVVFLLTQSSGGSGRFYYVVAGLNKENKYVGSHAFFLGDRIAPQTTEVGNNRAVIVNFADRAPGESFATSPSVGKTVRLRLNPATLEFKEVTKEDAGR